VDKFLALVVSGAVTGALYSLVASGLTLSYSATGIFNFAYGGVAFSAAYLFYEFNTALHWPVWVAFVVVVVVFAPLLGLLLDAAVFRPLARASESAKIVATIGLLLALPALTEWLLDGLIDVSHVSLARSATVLQVGFPSGLGPVPQVTWHLPGNIPVNSNEVVVLAAAVVCAALLYLLMRRTSLGLRMRAVVDRPDLARMRGVDNAVTSRYAWVIGTVLAALAGVIGAPILGSISTDSYTVLVFVAAAAAVLGRLRSVPLAFVGGLVLGIAQDLVTGYASFASNINGFDESVPVVILLVALVVLHRRRGRQAGQASDEVPPADYLAGLPKWRRGLPWVLATGFLIAYITVLSNNFWAGVMAEGLALSLVFLSFVVVTGMGGMVSLAQATFVTAAGLTTGLLFDHFGWPFYGAAAAAIVITVVIGMIVALPALRLGGLPLALATLALAILGDNVLFQWSFLTNQSSGWTIPRLVIGPLNLASNRTMAMVVLALVGVVMLLIRNLRVSSWGRSIAAVRSSEVAAATSGVSPVRVKMVLFAISAAIAGLGAIFYASFQTTMSSSTAPYVDGLLWLATVVLFGIRRPAAAAYAGIASVMTPVIINSGFHWWSWVPSWLSWNGTQVPEIPLILFGLGAVTLARNPDGFLAQGARQRYEMRRRKEARRALQLATGPALAMSATAVDGNGAGAGAPILAEQAAASELAAAALEVERHEAALVAGGTVHAPSHPVPSGLLTVRDLVVGYGDVEVLHGIDLSVPAGQVTALFGANGGGKSTLCSTLAGLVVPRSGTVTLDGEDVTMLAAHRRVAQGLMVAPESRGIFPGLSVEENLQLRLSAEHREAAYGRFPRLGERRRQSAGSLSGGEQQMLALAPVLVDPPRVVVADEPTLGLAPLVIGELLELFSELRALGTAILVVEEKVRDVLTIADQVAFIELGHIVWSGARGDIDDRRLVGAYFGSEQ